MRTRLFYYVLLLLTTIGLVTVPLRAQVDNKGMADQAYQSGKYSRAVDLLKKVVKTDDKDAFSWQYLGTSYLKLKKYKDAIKAFQKAVSIEPSNDQYLALLAFAYLAVRDDRAESTALSALKINQQNFNAHYVLGRLAYRSEMYAAAYDRAKRAIQLNPDFSAAYRLKSQSLVASFLALRGKVLPPGARGDLLVEAAEDLDKFAELNKDASIRDALEDEKKSVRYFADYYALPENRLARDVTIVEPPDPNKTDLKVLSKPRPAYTDRARERNVQGTVQLLIAFDVSGKVGPMMVIKSLDDDLDRAAIIAARGITFTPPTKNGVPYSTVKIVEYSFTIY